VTTRGTHDPVATLWRLGWNEDWISCAVYQQGPGLEMRLESRTSVIMSEPFEIRPRVLARMQALRASLKRRGWQDLPD
jgi:hypothetical protein